MYSLAIFWRIFGGHHFFWYIRKSWRMYWWKPLPWFPWSGPHPLGCHLGRSSRWKPRCCKRVSKTWRCPIYPEVPSRKSWSWVRSVGKGRARANEKTFITYYDTLESTITRLCQNLVAATDHLRFLTVLPHIPKTIVVQWFMSWFGWNRSILQGPSMKFGRSALSQCQYVGLAASVEVKHFTAMYCTSHSFLGICTYFMMNVTWTYLNLKLQPNQYILPNILQWTFAGQIQPCGRW